MLFFLRFSFVNFSSSTLCSFRNRVIKRITFTKFVVIMLSFVSFIKIQVVIWKEMIMILWAYQFVRISVFTFVRVEKCSFILTKFIVVIFVIKILVSLLYSFVSSWSELINYFLKACLFSSLHNRLLRNRININIKFSKLICYVIHSLLNICLFSVGWEI